MPDTTETDLLPVPAEAAGTPPHTIPSNPEDGEAAVRRLTIPDWTPLMDVAEGRINFMMDSCEKTLRSAMLVSAAGLECGTIWTRGWRDIRAHAVTSIWRTSQMSVGASSELVDRWMDVQVRNLDATAARLADAA